MLKRLPKVVVITLNYNQFEYTKDCIDSLVTSKYDNYEILVIDNGSEESSYVELSSYVNSYERVILKRLGKNLGYVGGINYGMHEAKKLGADYFLVMNNDTVIDENAVLSLVQCAERYKSKAIVSGKVYNYDEEDTLQYIGQSIDKDGMLNQKSIIKNRREKDVGQYDEEMEMGMLDDIFWLLPIGAYNELGNYSEFFFLYGEQNDYGFRALSAGYKLIYCPLAKIWHKGGVTTCDGDKKSPKIEYWTSFAVMKLAVLHFPDRAGRFIRVWVLRQTLKNTLLFILRKKRWGNISAVLKAYSNFKHWNKIRYQDNGYNPFS